MDTTIQKTPVAGVGGAYTNTGIISQDGITPITSESLQPVKPVSIPSPYVSTAADSILGTTGAVKDTLTAQLKKDEETKAAAAETSKSNLKSIEDQILGVQTSRTDLEKTAGIDVKAQKLSDITTQLEAAQRAQTNELRALDGQGLTDVQKAAQSREINRRAAFEQADLALIQSAANRDYSTAQSIVDRKINLQLEPLKLKLDFAKTFYEDNKADLTKAEDRQFQDLITKNNREYTTEKDFRDKIGTLQLQALKDGNTSLFTALSRAKTDKDIGNIIYSNINPTGGDTKAATTAKAIFSGTSNLTIKDVPIKDRPAVEAALNTLKNDALASNDIYGVIRASAGGAATGDTFNNSFEKAVNVSQQIGDLQKSMVDAKTGPLLGIIRSNNPYDTKAKLIQAQLQAIVPNLARGVYGEVGVLTDNDIANYSKTLGNLTTTEEANQALLGISLKSVQRSLENKIKVAAGLGKDVSGILQVYKSVKDASDEQLARPIETASKASVLEYVNKNPSKKSEVENALKTAETGLGRKITYTELLQAYPEYK